MNSKLHGLYLCAKKHRITRPRVEMRYNDVMPFEGIDYLCSCEDVSLQGYDFIIATPPCNYYSRANQQREVSRIAQSTKHLLPWCIETLRKVGVPFLVENVLNASLVPYCPDLYQFAFGGHTYWSNFFFLVPDEKSSSRPQRKEFLASGHRDDNYNNHLVIDCFIEAVEIYLLGNA